MGLNRNTRFLRSQVVHRLPRSRAKIMRAIAAPALPVGLGGCIYVLWRSNSLFVFRWFEIAGLHPVIQRARLFTACARPHLPTWFIYSLPDATWVACGV